jgi:hypothetical protein
MIVSTFSGFKWFQSISPNIFQTVFFNPFPQHFPRVRASSGGQGEAPQVLATAMEAMMVLYLRSGFHHHFMGFS